MSFFEKIWQAIKIIFVKKEPAQVPYTPPEPSVPAVPIEKPELGMRVPGVDFSHWQEKVIWEEVYAAGYRFAIVKATDGASAVESTLADMRRKAKEAGLIVGLYHFFRFDDDPVAQATNFLKATGGIQKGELPMSLDVEWDNKSKDPGYRDSEHGGTRGSLDEKAANAVLKFLEVIEKNEPTMPIIIYTSHSFFQNFSKPERFINYIPWVPAYRTTVEKVKVPKPWPRLRIWQCADDLKFTGITKGDGNYFYGSYAQLKALTKQ